MAQLLKLRLVEGNDTTVALTATRNGEPIVLASGVGLELYLKTTQYQDDDDAITLTRAGGEITVTDAADGEAEASIDGSLIVTSLTFWRFDVIETGARHTVLYGDLEVADV